MRCKAVGRMVVLVALGLLLAVSGARAQTVPEDAATAPPEAIDPGTTVPAAVDAGAASPAVVEEPEPLPEPEAGPTVTLQEAFELAVARHPNLRAIRSELDRADGILHQAWGALLPRISAQLMYTLSDQETTIDLAASFPSIPGFTPPGPMVVRRQNIVQSQVAIQAPLFNMPIYSAIETAQLAQGAASFSEEEARRQLLLGVAVAFHGALAAGEVIGLQQSAFDTARERLRAANARLSLGAGRAIDAARAELELETARLGHEAAILGYAKAREALAGLLVMDDLPVPAQPDDDPAAPGSEDELVDAALENRPDLALRRTAADIAEQNLWTAWSAFFPTLSAAWQLTTEITDPPDFGGRRNMWALVVVLGIPIYDESRYGLLDQRRAEVLQAEANLSAAELTTETEVRTAWQEYESSLTTIETAERQVAMAAEALRLAEKGFENGAATSLDVDEAQQRLNSARIGLTVQRYQSRMALVKLLFLVGEIPME